MPKPRSGESQSDWMGRCVPVRIGEGDKRDQAVAVCLSMYREKGMEEEVKNKLWDAFTSWESLMALFNKEKPEDVEEKNAHPFMIWKDDETGVYRWLAVYSSKWRDDDNPPEILASAAHKEFVDAVDKGDWPYPELWLWHIDGSKFGVADFVAYDDTGFPIASGTVDQGKEWIAEALSKQDDLAMSHGMPVMEIERDTEDPTIITRYRSIEISPLPRKKAANKHGTGFEILTEVKMAIPEEKRPDLEGMLGGADGLKAFEESLADKAKELEGMEIESKEDSEQAAEEEEQVETEEGAEKEESPIEETPNYVTAEEVAEAVGAYLKPLVEQVATLIGTVEEQGKELKELKKDDDAKLKEELQNTPAASLFDRIGSVIGTDETYVDGRTTLAKAGPKEVESPVDGPTHVPILNEYMSRSRA